VTAPPDPHLAEKWFLANGLPAVLRPGALVRRIGPRSAPALAALAAMMVCSAIIVALTGKHTIDINGTPTRTEWFVLGIFVLVLPVACLVGWAVSRIATVRYRAVAAVIAILVTVVAGFFGGPSPRQFVNMLLETVVVAVILLSTATGLGSVLGWATRMTFAHFASLGALLVRALPVMLLTVLVFFNSLVWTMASTVSRTRLWMALLFLFVIAAAFLVSNTLSRARPIMEPDAKQAADAVRLAGTPFEAMPDRPRRVPLSRPERINVVFVLALSQLAQVLAVAVATGLIFFAFGLILISPELLDDWTHGGSSEGQILGMTFPVPGALVQTTMFLTALTFMYLAARAVSDKEYRAEFLDPVLDDLRLTLTARDRYRTATAAR
jgi:hypothetical protein